MAEEHSIRTISVLNLMNQNRGNRDITLSMNQLEKLLQDWIEEGYFYQENGEIYIGVRSVAEFGDFLRNKFNVDSCHLCKTVLLKVRNKKRKKNSILASLNSFFSPRFLGSRL